jgi:hypothetical protein
MGGRTTLAHWDVMHHPVEVKRHGVVIHIIIHAIMHIEYMLNIPLIP